MAAGAGVAEHNGRWDAVQLHLVPESREQFAAALRAASSLAWRGANEDLAQLPHTQILCRDHQKSRLVAFEAIRRGIEPTLIAHSAVGETTS